MKVLVASGNGLTGNSLRIISSEFLGSSFHFHTRNDGDLTNINVVKNLISKSTPEVILLNAASLSSSMASGEKQKIDNDINFEIFKNFTFSLGQNQKLFCFSSYHVYSGPPPFGKLIIESLKPTSNYAMEKSEEIRFARDKPNIYFILFPHLFGRFDNYEPSRAHFIANSIRRIVDAKKNNLPEIEYLGSSEQVLQFATGSMAAKFALNAVRDSTKTSFQERYIAANIGWKSKTALVFEELCNIIGYGGIVKKYKDEINLVQSERDMFYRANNLELNSLSSDFILELKATVQSYVDRSQ